MNKNQFEIPRGFRGVPWILFGNLGAKVRAVSALMALVTVIGCMVNSNGGSNSSLVNCTDSPPDIDTKKINPGMYIESGLDSLKLPFYVQVYHSNGIVYFRIRNYPDGTIDSAGNIAEESWNTYLDTGSQVKWGGSGGERKDYTPLTVGVPGGWSQAWDPAFGIVSFFKRNVTATSFQTVRKNEVRDNDNNLLGCTWEAQTYKRIRSEQATWPPQLIWPEVWPDSVKRN